MQLPLRPDGFAQRMPRQALAMLCGQRQPGAQVTGFARRRPCSQKQRKSRAGELE